MQSKTRNLTVRDRILLHLATFELYETDHWSPTQVTQKGIAKAVGILQRHIPQYVRPMIEEGLVKENSNYVQGGKQHQKVYFLTGKGRMAAVWMRDNQNDQLQDHHEHTLRSAHSINSKTNALGLKKTRRLSARVQPTSVAP